MATLRDLIGNCPGCGQAVAWPFTQSLKGSGRDATQEEKDLLGATGLSVEGMREVGSRIPTVRDGTGNLWHEPCWIAKKRAGGATIHRIGCQDPDCKGCA